MDMLPFFFRLIIEKDWIFFWIENDTGVIGNKFSFSDIAFREHSILNGNVINYHWYYSIEI